MTRWQSFMLWVVFINVILGVFGGIIATAMILLGGGVA